ncbi:transglutaminaseTgpA domain-containing protein [Paenibacillus sp. Marseille-Q4541]|uniref:transglutaminase TgpA family protein n=1 Tax=Paenibacillus sp. Marseille-Q4541 TaxID=2831522 RepID=UPI001BA66935|nr:transglutaminaseTgpA domain-containing protein [Paenibacillus sp. Marseille-Q4541]
MRIFSSKLTRSWYSVFALLWIVMIGMQWVSYTEPVWFQETTALVAVTLIGVAISEIIFPFRTVFRLFIKLILIGFILYYVLSFYGIFIPDGTLSENLADFLAILNPYLWFSLSTWVMMECILRLVTDARRVLLFLAMNIIALGILDSFTPAVLWKEIAWIVFAGMAWLVCLHLRKFQLKYPQGWKRLRRDPFKIIANVIVIFSLIIVAGVNMPTVPPILMDPYTAWVQYRGDVLPTGTSQDGENGASPNSESGYSREDNQLGGGFNYDYSPVMTINTTERSYWRGETRDEYSGTGWQEPSSSRRSFDGVNIGSELDNGGAASQGNTREVTQTVTMLNETVYPVLFGAYAINEVTSIDGESEANTLLWKSGQAELHWDGNRNTAFPRTYTIRSEVPLVPVEALMLKTYDELYGAGDVNPDYLQVPNHFPERVTQLAEEITAGAEYPYEKVGLLQDYLTTNFSYTNNPDLSLKQSKDFVEGFLFEVREGYCDYFSTSLVMMARSLDIPARWVKGYAPGQASYGDGAMLSQENGETPSMSYTVTNADAHSWAEVYFGEEYGWIPVEATPGFNMPLLTDTQDRDQVETPEEEEEIQPEETPEPENNANEPSFTVSPVIVWAAVSVLIAWVGYILWRNRYSLHFYVLRLRLGKPLTPEQKVVVETERWIRTVRRKGLRRDQHETLRESVTRWEQEAPQVANELAELLKQFEMARYSPDHVQEDAWQRVQDIARQMKKRLKSARG